MQRMELLARLDAVTRRVVVDPSSEVLAIGGLRVNLAARQLLCDDTPVVLTARDFDLSVLFLRRRAPVIPQADSRVRVEDYS
jgi:DNA-binding response OmpR family regulator